MASTSLREPLLSSAVAFLQDPTVAASPLAKRLAFLESKGLTPSETEEALRRASSLEGSPGRMTRYSGGYRQDQEAIDWRDWFVMTVIGGGVGYLLINLAKKYLVPALKPPTQTELEEAQARLEKKYDEASEILRVIQSDTEIVKREMTDQGEKLNQSIKEVELAVEECLAGEVKRDEDIKKVQEEVERLKDALPQMLETNKEAQTAAILDLQTELKSLKSLISARPPPASIPGTQSPSSLSMPGRVPGAGTVPSSYGIQPTSTSSLSRFTTTRPAGIPAWQLASTTTASSTHAANGDSSPGGSLSIRPPSASASSGSGSSPLTKPLGYTNGNPASSAQQGSPSPKLDHPRHTNSLDDDDDHIVNRKYTPEGSTEAANGTINESVEDLMG